MYMAFPFLGCCVRMKVQEGFASIKSLLNIVEMRSDSLHGHSAEIRITWHLPVFLGLLVPTPNQPPQGEVPFIVLSFRPRGFLTELL